jgi:hypothetical protein
MKRTLIVCTVLGLALFLYPQQQPTLQHVTGVTNVEVPVRVYDGDRFVDDLTLNDFEVLENGVPQKVAAVYLVRKTSVLRKELTSPMEPNTHRTFYLDFELYEYLPKLREGLALFVNKVLHPDDDLAVITPMRTYRLKSEVLARLPKEQVIEDLNGLVRKDVMAGNIEYRHALDDVKLAARDIIREMTKEDSSGFGGGNQISMSSIGFGTTGDIDEIIEQYRSYLARLENMREVDQRRILGLARHLEGVPGQKHVFLFYQKEYIPVLEKKTLGLYIDSLPEHTQMSLNSLFDFHPRPVTINANLIEQTFSNSSIAVHFLFLTPSPTPSPGLSYDERSEDIFNPFLEIAKATGGMAESTANPAFAMQKAGEASENYYLLYYVPGNSVADGKFKEIKVSVKGRSYQVTNRAGYFAN